MQAHELITAIGPDHTAGILRYFRDEERPAYKNALATLAAKRKLRPVFVQQKSVPDQITWMARLLANRTGSEVAAQLLQVWLLKARQPMLVRFLDHLGIEHDGNGSVDDLPAELDPEKTASAINDLLDAFPAWEVAVYLHIFQSQQPDGWPPITAALESDPRLTNLQADP